MRKFGILSTTGNSFFLPFVGENAKRGKDPISVLVGGG